MRFPRSSLLGRWRDASESPVLLLEAPPGFGKSWLLRRLVPRGTPIRRGIVGDLDTTVTDSPSGWFAVDDAHLLAERDIDALGDLVDEFAGPVLISGRLIADQLRRAVQLADGLFLGAADLALDEQEFAEALESSVLPPALHTSLITEGTVARLIEVTDGAVGAVSAALDELVDRPGGGDVVTAAVQQRRAAALATVRGLEPADRAVIGALARVPGIEQRLLERLGGPATLRRLTAAGVPLQRASGGTMTLLGVGSGTPTGFEAAVPEREVAVQVADDLVARGSLLPAVSLLLDAGAAAEAVAALGAIPDSVAESMGPQSLLGLLGRLGTVVDDDPRLLLLRATANAVLGHEPAAVADMERAATLTAGGDGPDVAALRRRVHAHLGLRLAFAGRGAEALVAANLALSGLGTGEEPTLARAHLVMATLAQAEDSREGLQRAAEEYRVAAASWEASGEQVNARYCRSDLAMAALCPLGRYDEALATLEELLGTADISDTERSWYVLNEGFALLYANRLDSAVARFSRVSDLARLQSTPRLAAAAAWGRAVAASRHSELAETIRWLRQAENTALGDEDDTLGVPFLCDAAVMLGALGADDLAERYFTRAQERAGVYRSYVERAEYVIEARRGHLPAGSSVDERLACTPPWEWWRVLLVTAVAVAERGEVEEASALLRRADYELAGLGFADFDSVGEGRSHARLRQLIDHPEHRAAVAQLAAPTAVVAPATTTPGGTRVLVFGPAIRVVTDDGDAEVPAGNPQRLAGVVVANGGSASFDQIADAIWSGEALATTRARLRNVLMRLRRHAGEVVVRTGSGVRLAQGVSCDLLEFDRLASDVNTFVRSDPELSGRLAEQAVALAQGSLFADFEYDEWALGVRRRTEQQLLMLLDLLSLQAEDAGDLARAQQLAERALRLDRYTDSRYVRLADLLALDGRKAAALAVLADAGEVAGELGGTSSEEVARRRADVSGVRSGGPLAR